MPANIGKSHSASRSRKENEQVFSSESVLRNPVQLFLRIFRETIESATIAEMLAIRDIKAQYRKSLFGILWAFAPPLVLAFALSRARNGDILNLGGFEIPYAAYVIISMAFWQTFRTAVNSPIQGLSGTRAILCRVYFPREIVILSEFLKVCFYFLFEFTMIIGVFLWFHLPISWTAIFALPTLVLLVILGLSIGMLLSPFAVLFEDARNALSPALYGWMILTPVFFAPPTSSGTFSTIVRFNPVTSLLVTTRELMLGEPLTYPLEFALWSAGTILILVVATMFFRVAMPFVIERWSS